MFIVSLTKYSHFPLDIEVCRPTLVVACPDKTYKFLYCNVRAIRFLPPDMKHVQHLGNALVKLKHLGITYDHITRKRVLLWHDRLCFFGFGRAYYTTNNPAQDTLHRVGVALPAQSFEDCIKRDLLCYAGMLIKHYHPAQHQHFLAFMQHHSSSLHDIFNILPPDVQQAVQDAM